MRQDGMNSGDAGTRQGVCAGIQEVLENVTRQQLGEMLPTMLPTIQTALCDDNEAVRTVCSTSTYSTIRVRRKVIQ